MARPRARQTRLAFTPLPSSSPAAKGYPKQIQDRAAGVTIDGPAKRRKIGGRDGDDIPSSDGADGTIPTPAASLEQNPTHQDSDSNSEALRATQRSTPQSPKRASRARQQRIDFSSARDRDSFSSPVRLASSPSRPESSGRPNMFSSQRRRRVVDDSSESDDELPSAQALIAKSNKRRGRTEEESNGRRTRSSAQPATLPPDSEGNNIFLGSNSSNAIQVDSEGDDDEDMPTTIGRQRRKRQRQSSFNSFISSSPPRIIDSESEVEIIEKRAKKRRRQEASEDEDEPVTHRRERKLSQREKDELAEDLEDLRSSEPEEEDDDDDEAGVHPPRTQSSQKTAKGLALERLKRRREGKTSKVGTTSEYGEEDDEDTGEEDRQPMSSAQLFREDDYDEDFIEEEDEHHNTLGIPDGIPLEFTRYASMKSKELFYWAVDWMVQKRINPGFQMNDEIYRLTFRKLNDETKALVGSKFVSSAWTPEFAGALKARPEIVFEAIDRHSAEHWLRDKCDACNRSGHPATYEIQFQGNPYHMETLEEIGGNEDEESDSDSDSEASNTHNGADTEPAYDSLGNEIVPAVHTFYVGKFCMSNAQTAHALQHWRYHLNEYVVTWLVRQGYEAPEVLAKRNNLSTKKRSKKVAKILKRMEEEGVVKQLWSDFRRNIEEARNSKQGRF